MEGPPPPSGEAPQEEPSPTSEAVALPTPEVAQPADDMLGRR